MSLLQRRILISTLAMFLLAGAMGGALGVAMAKREGVQVQGGFNQLGGPFDPLSPETFLSCVDDDAWIAVYIYDGSDSTPWRRYINPAIVGDAGYLNEGTYAIEQLPPGSGLYLLMDADEPLQSITLLERIGETCNAN